MTAKPTNIVLEFLYIPAVKSTPLKNWVKYPDAVFTKTETVFGPGHCSFTTVSENAVDKDFIVYHANLQSGSGWRGRSVWVQEFSWEENDMPIFGAPHK